MIMVNIHEAKTHLSKYLEKASAGEKILVCKRNVPIAQIVPVEKPLTQKRPIGLAEGEFTVPQDFNDPLPDEEINAFYGNA